MQLIPAQTLLKADKILFINHLAIGDFTYLHNFFDAFSKAYPHLKIDLWIDEVRRTADASKWPFLKKYSLYDWVEQCPFFHQIYRRTYSPNLLQESIYEAQQKNYPIIVILSTIDSKSHEFSILAREIGANAYIVGVKSKVRWYTPWKRADYAKLNCSFAPFKVPQHHITDLYADWFHQLCDLKITKQEYFPKITIPDIWKEGVKCQLHDWGVIDQKIVFINAYAKINKRCWPLTKVVELINAMRQLPSWKNTTFIINTTPQEKKDAQTILAQYQLKNTHLFSAEDNFFQLPAMLEQCDLIISVETAVMHLANAVGVPVIALMRQKNPEWVPIDTQNSTVITTHRRRQWVAAITVDRIIQVLGK